MKTIWRTIGGLILGGALLLPAAHAATSFADSNITTVDTRSLKLLQIDTGLACYQMIATPLPDRQSGKNNLIVVTHGWEPSGKNADVSWITNLCDTIRSSAPGDWQVVPYAWLDKANGINTVLDSYSLNFFKQADNALHNAEDIGTEIGRQIAGQGWSHVHLIGHSAGAGLIQKAAEAIHKNAPGIEVHTTFLDPFLGLDYHRFLEYGTNADWSDSYYDRDFLTGSLTEGILPNAYNADVTWTESAPKIVPVIYAPGNLGCEAQTRPLSDSHKYPYEFYQETVLGTQKSCAVSLGFSLSKEGGGWNNHASYTNGGFSSPCEECPGSHSIFNQSPLNLNPQVNFGLSPYATSPSGVTTLDLSGFSLTSGSPPSPLAHKNSGGFHPLGAGGSSTNSTGTPSWLAVGLTITNAVNFIQFDAAFTDTNAAEGLLTVYWDTNQIGTVDERVVSPGLATHRFFLPETVTNNVYVLGFRLDAFDDTSPSITITNVATGFAGVTQPLTLGISLTNNTPILQLTGAPNFTYLVETSTNLVDWTPTALLLNTNGIIFFPDPTATNSGARFYRAVMP